MIKAPLALVAVLTLTACGGTRYASSNAVDDTNYTGPLPGAAPVQSSEPVLIQTTPVPAGQSATAPISAPAPLVAAPAPVVVTPAPVVVAAVPTAPAPAPAPVVKFARGPIQKACQASDRKARSRARCGCIQAVADRELSSAQQRRGAKYWKNPGKLQEVRQSDNAGNEAFWRAWKGYGQAAARVCKGT